MRVKLLQYKRCAIARDWQAVGWRVGCPKMIIVGVVCCAARRDRDSPPHLGQTPSGGTCPLTDTDPAQSVSKAILGKVAMRISSRSASERDKFWSGAMGRSREGLDHRTTRSRLPPRGQQIGNDRPSGDTYSGAPSWSISLLRVGPTGESSWGPAGTFGFGSWAGTSPVAWF